MDTKYYTTDSLNGLVYVIISTKDEQANYFAERLIIINLGNGYNILTDKWLIKNTELKINHNTYNEFIDKQVEECRDKINQLLKNTSNINLRTQGEHFFTSLQKLRETNPKLLSGIETITINKQLIKLSVYYNLN